MIRQFPNKNEENEESEVEECRGDSVSVLDEIGIHQNEIVDAVQDGRAEESEKKVYLFLPRPEFGEGEEIAHDDGEEEVRRNCEHRPADSHT